MTSIIPIFLINIIYSQAIKSGLKKDSVLAAKRDSKRYSESIFRRDALLGLERCAGEVVSDMLKIVEDCYPDEAEMRLIVSGM